MKWKLFALVLATGLPNTAFGNIIGSDHQNFNPGATIEDYITVHSAKTLGQGRFSLGLHLNYGVNTLPYFNTTVEENRDTFKEYNDSLSALDATIAVGLLENLDLTLVAPYIVHQEIKESSIYHGQFDKIGNTELRTGIKYAFIPLNYIGFAVVGTVNYNRVENNPYTGDEKWPSYNLELVGEIDFGLISGAVNIGHRWRNSGEAIAFDDDTPIQPFENQFLFSMAGKLEIPATDWQVIVESYGSYTEDDFSSISPRNASVLEGVAALRYRPSENFFAQLGGGAEMRHAVSSFDRRYFLGFNWALGPFKSEAKPEPELVVEDVKVLSANRPADEVVVLEDVLFDFNSDRIRSRIEEDKLKNLDSVLRSRPIEKVVIEGHACAIGTEVYNIDLSERRADSVVEWVVDRFGFPREKVIPVGFGEQRPHISNEGDANRRRNRRVRFEVYYQQ